MIMKSLIKKLGRAVFTFWLSELRVEIYGRVKGEIKAEIEKDLKIDLIFVITSIFQLPQKIKDICDVIIEEKKLGAFDAPKHAIKLRRLVRSAAGLSDDIPSCPDLEDLIVEFRMLFSVAQTLRPAFEELASRRVLFCGQAYYNAWYLSRALRCLGWKADVYNWDTNTSTQIYYHGEDICLGKDVPLTQAGMLSFYLNSIYGYDVFHFSNANGITYGEYLKSTIAPVFGINAEIYILKALGKIIVYSNNGCLDGVSQSQFAKWGPESVCSICRWKDEPSVCNDERNLSWGGFRNQVADYQCLSGGNRVDYNEAPTVHEAPEFYCLDPQLWHPDIEIPKDYLLPTISTDGVRVYHAVGNREERTSIDGINIKSSHVYLPLIDRLRDEGLHIELIHPNGIPNKKVRYLQAQADIFLEMLTYGWFGANAREAMMLGKPVICFIRPEWLESVREEIPAYADELPIISATPHTVEAILRDLILNPQKRSEIGQRGREFALKWHSSEVAGKRFDKIYSDLLSGKKLLRQKGIARDD
jgi:hypothetical protein